MYDQHQSKQDSDKLEVKQSTKKDSDQEKNGAAQLQSMADSYVDEKYPIQQKAVNNTGLPDQLKSGIENLSGYSMDDVKVHYNSDKPAQLQAHAYAQGNQIHLASGQEKHLPHEAWHVVQQKQGRVKPTKQLKAKVNINDDAGLEKEADVMGAKASKSASSQTPSEFINPAKKSLHAAATLQGMFTYKGKRYDEKSYKDWKANIHGVSKKAIIELAKSDTDFGDIADKAGFEAQIAVMAANQGVAAAAAADVDDEIVYPFPASGAPKFLYRWSSSDEARTAVSNGITKSGGIHDGIPTMPNLIDKSKAESGGGVGIVDASACIRIDTSLIPEIAARQDNSIRQTPARGGVEYKIMVDIPSAAITRLDTSGKGKPQEKKVIK